MKLWVYTDNTKYRLPIYVEDTSKALAEKLGVSVYTVRKCAWYTAHNICDSRIYSVDVTKEELES